MGEVVPAGCRLGGLKRRRPLFVGFHESPDLIGRQAEVAQRLAEWLAPIDRFEELLPYIGG